jgi:hypothetical protein
MHREGLAWGTMGSQGLCKKYLMPIMRKQQYRFQMVNPIPTVSGRFACSAIGASTMPPDAGRAFRRRRGHGLPRLAQAQLLRVLRRDMRLLTSGIVALLGTAGLRHCSRNPSTGSTFRPSRSARPTWRQKRRPSSTR